MKETLRTAALAALPDVNVLPRPTATHLTDAEEYERLRQLHRVGAYQALAARLTLLTLLGWKRTEIAEGVDISRVTLNKWVRVYTQGKDTFESYIEGVQYYEHVLAPIISKLSPTAARRLSGLAFRHDKLEVPLELAKPLQALWRVAYRARGPKATTDPEIVAAGDALDVLVSLLLRRGMTNLAIAKAAQVTHRAVLARMQKAQERGTLLECSNGFCEGFYGEQELLDVEPDVLEMSGRWLDHDNLAEENGNVCLAFVRLSRPSPDNFWLQTLQVVDDVDTPELVRIEAHPVAETWTEGDRLLPMDQALWARIQLALPGADEILQRAAPCDEIHHAWNLGRFGEYAGTTRMWTNYIRHQRENVVAVPASLLYSKAAPRLGNSPIEQIPHDLWKRYYAPHTLVVECFTDSDKVFASYPEISRVVRNV